MHSKGYCSWFVCVCVCACACACVCVCLSTAILALQAKRQLMSNTSRFTTMRCWKIKRQFSRNNCIPEIWHENKWIKPIHTASNVYTTRWTYLLAVQKSFNWQISLKVLPWRWECFLLVFGFLAFTVYSYLIAHTRALTWCTCDNPVHAAPAQKVNTVHFGHLTWVV